MFRYNTAKEMLDILKVTYEGTTELKMAIMNILTRVYELFKMKHEKTIQDMENQFIHIFNHLRTMGKIPNEDLINKVLRCLNCN